MGFAGHLQDSFDRINGKHAEYVSRESIAQKTENFSANFSLPPREARRARHSNRANSRIKQQIQTRQASSKQNTKGGLVLRSLRFGKFESASAPVPSCPPTCSGDTGRIRHRSDYILPIRIFIPARTSCAANRSHLFSVLCTGPADCRRPIYKGHWGIGTTQHLALKWLAREIL